MRRQISQQEFEAECLRGWPNELASWARQEALDKEQLGTRQSANLWLVRTTDAINDSLLDMSFELIEDDGALREKAKRLARLCAESGDVDGMRRIAEHYGITPPDVERFTKLGQYRRLSCERWWRRKLRARYGRVAEDAMRKVGLVRAGRAPYVSEHSLRRRRGQRHTLQKALDAAIAVSESGKAISLKDAVESSIANPENRRAELMTRLRGLESIARSAGHAAVFYTLTAPSAFHAQLRSGRANPRYEGHTVRQCMTWLNRQWARARAAIHRAKILVYGFRVAEPHHDGTPHFHLLLFLPHACCEAVFRILRRYWLQDYADEPGAGAARIDAKPLDLDKGSAVGYLSKYIAKNVDGFRVDRDLEADLDATDGAARVDAWAATHGIRQFQQIGGPPPGLWREIRRLRRPVKQTEIEPARAAADDGDYATFVSAIGRIEVGRRARLSVWLERTGELSMYDDPRAPLPVGVRSDTQRCRTREGGWRIRWGGGTPSEIVTFLPWTCGNNCTGELGRCPAIFPGRERREPTGNRHNARGGNRPRPAVGVIKVGARKLPFI
jgi:Bacteriophage replication gene A protein (GPA)